MIKSLADKANALFSGLRCDVFRIRNDFFGDTITVTGLITARDLTAQLKDRKLGCELLLSSAMIRREHNDFLDDVTVEEVEKNLNTPIRIVSNDGYELLDAMLGIKY